MAVQLALPPRGLMAAQPSWPRGLKGEGRIHSQWWLQQAMSPETVERLAYISSYVPVFGWLWTTLAARLATPPGGSQPLRRRAGLCPCFDRPATPMNELAKHKALGADGSMAMLPSNTGHQCLSVLPRHSAIPQARPCLASVLPLSPAIASAPSIAIHG